MSKTDEILKSLSIDEKIRLLNGVGSWNTFGADGKIPVISMSDGPHGLRHQVSQENYANINESRRATCFPTASAIASSWDTEAIKKMGAGIAHEAKAEDVQIVLGCGMNIKRSPLCGRNFEYFSEDPLLTGELAAAFVHGVQKNGTGACIKHFALNNQEKYRQNSSSNVDERTMREIYLAGFERAVKEAKPISIMCSYNKINGTFASANKKLLTDILRDEWGFDGIVISDWGADIDAVESLKAGLDLGMPDSYGYLCNQIKKAYEDGRLTDNQIDTACKRIIDVILKLDEKRNKDAAALSDKNDNSVDYTVQHQTAFELACESAVLLKNDGFFPLVKATDSQRQKLLIVGELADKMQFQGGGSSHISTADYPSALDCFKKDFDVIYVPGYCSTFCTKKKKAKINKKLLQDAVQKITEVVKQKPDIPVLYFCGLEESYEGEGFDRSDMKLPQSHLELYKALTGITKNLALITFSGSPIDLNFANEAHAIIHMYLCGEASGEACHALVTGLKNPCGKLAETWPVKVECGLPVDDFDVNYIEGTLAGYRWYETVSLPVQYEFGYGLSYTSFEYSDLKVTAAQAEAPQTENAAPTYNISLTVKNTGTVDGKEIVQVYIKNPLPPKDCGINRAAIELRAFTKVFLKSGEQKQITLQLDKNAFSIYSTKKHDFAVVGGEYKICVGASVKMIKLSETVNIKGEELSALVLPDCEEQKKVFIKHESHKKGEFTVTDCLGEMSKKSLIIRLLLHFFEFYIVLKSTSKSREDPAVKIGISGLRENPLESLISVSGGSINEKFIHKMLKWANR